MSSIAELYFKDDNAWREWLEANHHCCAGAYLIFYSVAHSNDSMRWEEAVRVALCFGWIDSTVKSLGNGMRRQYFCPRKPKSSWSKLNKTYVKKLKEEGLMHPSGLAKIKQAKEDGSWTALDDVENCIVPQDLQLAFNANPQAEKHYESFSRTYRKSYLYWLNEAKRPQTRQARISEIIRLCQANIKSRN